MQSTTELTQNMDLKISDHFLKNSKLKNKIVFFNFYLVKKLNIFYVHIKFSII